MQEAADAGNSNERIEIWLKEATAQAASRLRDLAEMTADKEIRKSARRALYRLSQAGIVPDRPLAVTDPAPLKETAERELRAFASAFDGAGNRLLFLIIPDSEGGSPLTAQILTNDELGIRDLGLKRMNRRELATLLREMDEKLETGLALAQIEADYARWLIVRYREINRRRSSRTPSGFIDLVPRIGEPTQSHFEPPIYSHFSQEEITADKAVPRDPAEFFKLRWFEPWFFAVEDVVGWLQRWEQTDSSVVVVSESIKQERKRSIIKEAAEKLMTPDVRQRYISRLEESADVLRRRDRITEAKIALVHALQLKEDQPAAEIPFAQAIVQRTIEAAMEMVHAARRKEGQASPR